MPAQKSSNIGIWVWLCIPASLILAASIQALALPLIGGGAEVMSAYKFTFIAVLMAVGQFQYNMFHDAAERFRKVIDDGDLVPQWKEFKDRTDALQAHNLAHPAMPETNAWLDELKTHRGELEGYVDWHRVRLPLIIREAIIRFVLIFSVGLSLLISLALEIIALLKFPTKFNAAALSQSFLFGALVFFACLFLFYVFALGHELSERMPDSPPK